METDTSFDQIYDELFPSIYRFVKFRVPESDVDDVTSEVMVKIWRSLQSFEGKSSVKSWAIKIAYNHIADYYRAKKNHSTVPLNEDIKELKFYEDMSERFAELSSVKEALAALTDTQITAIQLRLIEGFSSQEVSQILETTPQAIDSLLYRAKKSFRKAYEMSEQEVTEHDRIR